MNTESINPEPEPARPIDRKGPVVYVVGEAGSSVVKIGMTKNIRKRLGSIQTHYPRPLEVLWTHHGGIELEEFLHERFRRLRIHGEWFDFGKRHPVEAVSKVVKRRDRERYEQVEAELRRRAIEQGLPVS